MPKYLQTIFSTKPWLCISGLRFNLLFALFLLAAYNLPFARKLWSISPSVSFVAGGLFCAFTLLCAGCFASLQQIYCQTAGNLLLYSERAGFLFYERL